MTTAFKTYEDIINEGRRDGVSIGRKEGLDDGLRQGHQSGLIKGLLTVLRSRGLDVPETVEQAVSNATTEQLERWLAVAATVPTAEALLEE